MNCPGDFWCLQFKDVLNAAILLVTVVAIIVGPIVAVRITRTHEDGREKRRRKYEIFHNLMKTRKMILAPEHVTSLNVIQTEFADDADVMAAYKHYIELLYRQTPAPSEPEAVIKKFFEEQDDGFFELVQMIGKHLAFSLDKRDLAKYSYAPQGWGNAENQVNIFRHLVIELLNGRRALPITQFPATQISDKFPPAPHA